MLLFDLIKRIMNNLKNNNNNNNMINNISLIRNTKKFNIKLVRKIILDITNDEVLKDIFNEFRGYYMMIIGKKIR